MKDSTKMALFGAGMSIGVFFSAVGIQEGYWLCYVSATVFSGMALLSLVGFFTFTSRGE